MTTSTTGSRLSEPLISLLTPSGLFIIISGAVFLFFLSLGNETLFRVVTATGILLFAFGLFILVWSTRRSTPQGLFNVLCIGLLSAAILNLASAFSAIDSVIAPAVPPFPAELILAAWFLQAITLLTAALVVGRKVEFLTLVAVYGLVVAVILASAFTGIFPVMNGSSGDTAGIIARSAVILLIAGAVGFLSVFRSKFHQGTFSLLLAGYFFVLGSGILILFVGEISRLALVGGYIFWFAALSLFSVTCIHERIELPLHRLGKDLKECRQHFQIMNDYTYNWEYWTRPDRTFVYTTPSCMVLTGYTPEEFYTDPTLVYRIIHPRDQGRISTHFTDKSPAGNFSSLEFRIVCKDKNVRWMHHICHPVYDPEGILLGRRATNRDITMQKNAEREILHLASFSMHTPVLIAEVNPDGRPLFLNPAMQKTLSELGFSEPNVFVPEDLLKQLKEGNVVTDSAYSREVQAGGRHFSESVLVTPEFGSLRLYITDVTRQREAERHIEQQSRFLAVLLDTIPVPIFYRDLEGLFLGCNTAFEEFSGITRDQLIGRPVFDILPLFGTIGFSEADASRESPGHGPGSYESQVRFRDGSLRDVIFSRAPFFTAEGKTGGVIGTFLDITDRKRMEKALAEMNEELTGRVRERTQELEESNAALKEEVARRTRAERTLQETLQYTRTVIESNLDPMAVLTREGLITDVNAALEEVTGVSREFLVGSSLSLYLKGTGDLERNLGEIMIKGRIEGVPGRMLHSGGHTTPVLVNAAVFMDAHQRAEGIILTAHDVTRQEEDEAKIRASLQEKTVLLREIHHRVKNNLQIIISLLNLQSRRITDEQALDTLRESIQRVRAISLVHEKLYSGGDLAHISIRSYIHSLISSLVTFYNINAGNISIKLDVEDVKVDVTTAIPLGLIINELISNSIKHAFPDGRKGSISVSARDVDGWFQVSVGDDGVGMPLGLDWNQAETIGLKLVHALSEQLEGSLTLQEGQGTMFRLRIPLASV